MDSWTYPHGPYQTPEGMEAAAGWRSDYLPTQLQQPAFPTKHLERCACICLVWSSRTSCAEWESRYPSQTLNIPICSYERLCYRVTLEVHSRVPQSMLGAWDDTCTCALTGAFALYTSCRYHSEHIHPVLWQTLAHKLTSMGVAGYAGIWFWHLVHDLTTLAETHQFLVSTA